MKIGKFKESGTFILCANEITVNTDRRKWGHGVNFASGILILFMKKIIVL